MLHYPHASSLRRRVLGRTVTLLGVAVLTCAALVAAPGWADSGSPAPTIDPPTIVPAPPGVYPDKAQGQGQGSKSGPITNVEICPCEGGGGLAWIVQQKNSFRNFDFQNGPNESNPLDWPVDFIYLNNASISKVQSQMGMFLPCQTTGVCAAPMYMHYGIWSSYAWVTSANMKQSLSACTPAADLHQRIYAPSGRFYSTNWGYYVIGTTHYDYQELCGGWSGKSEQAEKAVCQDGVVALAYTGGACYYNGGPVLANGTATQNINGHYWMNDGTATEALVN